MLIVVDAQGDEEEEAGRVHGGNFISWIFPIISLSFHSTTAALSFVETLVVETATLVASAIGLDG